MARGGTHRYLGESNGTPSHEPLKRFVGNSVEKARERDREALDRAHAGNESIRRFKYALLDFPLGEASGLNTNPGEYGVHGGTARYQGIERVFEVHRSAAPMRSEEGAGCHHSQPCYPVMTIHGPCYDVENISLELRGSKWQAVLQSYG